MSTTDNKELTRQAIKVCNQVAGDISKVRPLYEKHYAPGLIYHNLLRGDMNWEQTVQHMGMLVSAFPDLNLSIDELLAEGDKAVIRYTIRATHKGAFMKIPATGKQIVVKGVEIDKIAGGKVVEAWDFPDTLGMMTQLGVIPGTAPKT